MGAFRTIQHHTFKIEPDHAGGATKSVMPTEYRFLPLTPRRGRKKSPPEKYLLIGFDTEYQSIVPVEVRDVRRGEADAKNTVLSYQFCVKLVSQHSPDSDLTASGIIVPEEGQRLAFGDFIAFAIGTWLDQFPAEKAPSFVYLVGHFTRADLPAFDEFLDITKSHLSAIRSTLISMGRAIELEIGDELKRDRIKIEIELRDTLLLAPGNAKSLSAVGEIVGFEKLRLHDDVHEEIRLKSNMSEVMTTNWPLFQRYAIRDAEICVRYAERIMRQHLALFEVFQLPITLTSFGTELVLRDWEKAGLDSKTVLGSEQIIERAFNKKLGYFKTKPRTVPIDTVHWELDFVTDSYHGGRNEQFMFGPAPEGNWRDLDLSSAYTTAMSLIGLPRWNEIAHIRDLSEIGMTDLAFACVDFEFPRNVRFPTLPVRTANGIIFPRQGRSTCGAPELWLANQLGATLTLVRGLRVPIDPNQPVFSNFIGSCINERNRHPKGTFDNLFWKEVGNSTYGKTAQGLRKKRVYDIRDDAMTEIPESRITQPFFASFITSYTRAVLGEVLNSFSAATHVFSVTTDGFLTTADDQQINHALGLPLASSFRQARSNLVGDDQALEVKHAVRQPIGWRTRGSATLIAGENEKNGFVLQKGGIKTDDLLNGRLENDHIIRLFLNRTPEHKLTYTTGIGIKDMMRSDTDFVFRANTKRLSMEFDWKRFPVGAHDAMFLFDGEMRSHLSFDTRPLESVEEFTARREAWEKYTKGSPKCLKTRLDLERFENDLHIRKQPASRYASKGEASDIKRLRRDLCRAFKAPTAGFDKAFARGKIPHKRFQAALIACGIHCSAADIDNGKRDRFEAVQCLDTPRVREALDRLKVGYFPELDIGAFLPEATPHSENDNSLVELVA